MQFVSGVMKEVCRFISIKQLTTAPYRPICNGLVEIWNGTLKILKRSYAEQQSYVIDICLAFYLLIGEPSRRVCNSLRFSCMDAP